MSLFNDIYFDTKDGLRLHARDYAQRTSATGTNLPPILCLAGLTRNARDFEGVAARLSDRRRVIVAEQRGRGQSAYDPKPENYLPPTYVQDMIQLIDHLALPKVTIIGTSLGGLMGMLMAAGLPERIAGLLLNDIGPEVAPAGLERIRSYIDRVTLVANWQDAAQDLKTVFGPAFPRYGAADWDKAARAIYRENDKGVPILDHDPAIAVNVKNSPATAPDLWPVWDALPPIPLAVIRGRLSNILSTATLDEMRRRRPDLLVAELDDIGHAPSLDEPDSIALIDRFLALRAPGV